MVWIRFIALFMLALSLGVLIAVSVKRAASGEKSLLLAMSGITTNEYLSHQFDKIRELVNAHSTYKPGVPGRPGEEGVTASTRALYDYAAGASETPPSLTSALRARVFARLLREAGFKARTVTLLQPLPPYYAHTLVEVYNDRSQNWELQDQDYNVFYTFKNSTQRVSLANMLSLPTDNFIPCHSEGDCNWVMASPEGLNVVDLRPLFAAAIIDDGNRMFLALNAARFDLEASGFCDKQPVLCNGEKIYYQ